MPKFLTFLIVFKKLNNPTVIIEGTLLARHLGSTKSKYLIGCNPGISILIGLAIVAWHIDPLGNDVISSSEKHLEKNGSRMAQKNKLFNFIKKNLLNLCP